MSRFLLGVFRVRGSGRKTHRRDTVSYSDSIRANATGGAADADSARVSGFPALTAAQAPSVLFHDTKGKIFLTLCNKKV